jgi:hypothetical protein
VSGGSAGLSSIERGRPRVAARSDGRRLPAAVRRFERRPSAWLLLALVLSAAAVALLDRVFVALNARKLVLPRFDVRLMPYHDPRFTLRHASLLAYARPPRIVFTGDSRTMDSFDPEAIARALGVAPDLFFNFATGSQLTGFAREVFIPHLLETGRAPKYVVFGVTPEWLINRRSELIGRYHSSLAYRLSHPGERDRIESALWRFLARHVALYRYRGDFVASELVPGLRCLVLCDCQVWLPHFPPIHFKRLAYLDGVQTRFGYGPWDVSNGTGEYYGSARFTDKDQVDREALVGLLRATKRAGITPVLLVMPMHPTFNRVHEPAMSRNYRVMDEAARLERVDVLYPKRDYSEATLFTDGHHHTLRGSAYFSADVAPLLLPYLEEGR